MLFGWTKKGEGDVHIIGKEKHDWIRSQTSRRGPPSKRLRNGSVKAGSLEF